ncbi:MAG: acyl-CoA dehydrogenase family protein [Thermodesulfobacteriota bacterium]|nr:acyl-CoA dehydrogenase family protein [Thermodesulfobacteriota bacterium]
MDFGFTEEQDKLRQKVRDFLEERLKIGDFQVTSNGWIESYSQEFSKEMSNKGWIGMTWPGEYGGKGHTYIDRAILMEEMLTYQAPIGFHFLGDRQVGPAIMHFGNEEQKKEYLPKIINADIAFAIGLSEPNAGSDLVSVKTFAKEEEDCFVMNGQKVWTTGAHRADYIWMIARTDLEAPKHKGISEFIVDLKSPGVTVRPIINIAGVHSFNEVFFDDVKIPKENLVGVKNRGFYQLMAQVDYERAGLERLMQNYPLFVYLLDYVKKEERDGQSICKNPHVRNTLAELEIEYQVGRLFCYQVAWTLTQGHIPNREAALCKAYCTQYEQRLSDAATRILGLGGRLMPGSKWAPLNGEAPDSYLWAVSYTIQGGSLEVLKNIVATRGLGLPVAKMKS